MTMRSITFVDGKRGILEQTREEWEAENGPLPPTARMVSVERDRRRDAGFEYDGNRYDSDQKSLLNIAGAGATAGFAVVGGQDGAFPWITEDNKTIALDAAGMFAMSQAALIHISRASLAARAIKDMAEIPADFTDDKYWGLENG